MDYHARMQTYSFISALIMGTGVGLVSTVLGIGGGILMVPFLPLVTGISQKQALATSLCTIFFVASMNTLRFSRKKLVVWRCIPPLAGAAVAAAFTAAKFAVNLPEYILCFIFACVTAALASKVWMGKELQNTKASQKSPLALSIAIGGLAGTMAGLTGIGGGGIVTPLLLVTGLAPGSKASPTSNAVMIFTTFAATAPFAFASTIDLPSMGLIRLDLAAALFAGAALSSTAGIKINTSINPKLRRILLTILLLISSTRMLIKGINVLNF